MIGKELRPTHVHIIAQDDESRQRGLRLVNDARVMLAAVQHGAAMNGMRRSYADGTLIQVIAHAGGPLVAMIRVLPIIMPREEDKPVKVERPEQEGYLWIGMRVCWEDHLGTPWPRHWPDLKDAGHRPDALRAVLEEPGGESLGAWGDLWESATGDGWPVSGALPFSGASSLNGADPIGLSMDNSAVNYWNLSGADFTVGSTRNESLFDFGVSMGPFAHQDQFTVPMRMTSRMYACDARFNPDCIGIEDYDDGYHGGLAGGYKGRNWLPSHAWSPHDSSPHDPMGESESSDALPWEIVIVVDPDEPSGRPPCDIRENTLLRARGLHGFAQDSRLLRGEYVLRLARTAWRDNDAGSMNVEVAVMCGKMPNTVRRVQKFSLPTADEENWTFQGTFTHKYNYSIRIDPHGGRIGDAAPDSAAIFTDVGWRWPGDWW